MAKVNLQFPNIYRSFTERAKKFSKKNLNLIRQFKFQTALTLYILVVASLILLFLNVLISLQKQKEINLERTRIESEIKIWEELSNLYPGYKEIYYQLAVLEFNLGNFDKAKFYVNKALYLDPNFQKAKSLYSTLKSY